MNKYVALFLGTLLMSSILSAQTAIVAGGCFWCVESDMDKLAGVIETTSGYDGGKLENPTYEMVASGKTSYVETVKVSFDSKKISYKELLKYFVTHIDPFVKNRQFCDIGAQYRPVIFYLNEAQKNTADELLNQLKEKFGSVYIDILPSTTFYKAEDYHQAYYKKNPLRYKYYRWNCGRDARVKEIWDGISL